MATKDVTITIKVKLRVPADDEYDEESYFADLRTHITDEGDNYLTQASAAFQEVDKIEVILIRTQMCEHPEYRDGRCLATICDNYVGKHRS